MSWLVLIIAAAILIAPRARAATVDHLRVRCNVATVQGKIEVDAPYVRIQIALASNLTTSLASDVFPVQNKGTYSARLDYPAQAEGTLLVVAVGEWDGQQYVRPATITSQACAGGGVSPDVTPTPPSTPILPTPTPYPLATIETVTKWEVIITHQDDGCGLADSSPFAATLMHDPATGNFTLRTSDYRRYELAPSDAHSGFVAVAYGGDVRYVLDLFFTGTTTFIGNEYAFYAEQSGCYWVREWSATLRP
jgi:hypothetical protein